MKNLAVIIIVVAVAAGGVYLVAPFLQPKTPLCARETFRPCFKTLEGNFQRNERRVLKMTGLTHRHVTKRAICVRGTQHQVSQPALLYPRHAG